MAIPANINIIHTENVLPTIINAGSQSVSQSAGRMLCSQLPAFLFRWVITVCYKLCRIIGVCECWLPRAETIISWELPNQKLSGGVLKGDSRWTLSLNRTIWPNVWHLSILPIWNIPFQNHGPISMGLPHLYGQNSLHSSGKLFQKKSECFNGNLCQFNHNSHVRLGTYAEWSGLARSQHFNSF